MKESEEAKRLLLTRSDGWISLQEACPSIGEWVLVWGVDETTYGRYNHHVVELYDYDDGPNPSSIDFVTESGKKIEKVKYWRPLPKAPQ
jgi:Protein of unknown function (DUF551)